MFFSPESGTLKTLDLGIWTLFGKNNKQHDHLFSVCTGKLRNRSTQVYAHRELARGLEYGTDASSLVVSNTEPITG